MQQLRGLLACSCDSRLSHVLLLLSWLQLCLPLLCDDARLGHKGIMHRHVRQLDKPSKVRCCKKKYFQI
jgi:hypothetical protein